MIIPNKKDFSDDLFLYINSENRAVMLAYELLARRLLADDLWKAEESEGYYLIRELLDAPFLSLMTKYSLYGNATYGVDELRSKRVLAMLGFRLSSGLSGDVNREIPLLNKHIEYFRFIDDLLNYSSSDYLSSFVNGVNLSDRYLICENSCFRIYEGVGDGRYQLSLYANKEYLFGGSDKLSVEAILLLKYLIDGIYDNQEELPYLINKDANKYSYRNSRGSTIRNWASFLNGHIKSYGYVVKRRVNTFSLHKIAR